MIFTVMNKTPIKAILIDSVNRAVREVELHYQDGHTLDDMYKYIGCDCVTIAPLQREDDTESLFVDDEGLLKGPENFFTFDDAWNKPLAGNGLLVGLDPETGESISTSYTVDDVKSKTAFHSILEVRTMFMKS